MFVINQEVLELIRALITSISGFQENTKPFKHVEKYFVSKIQQSDSLFFVGIKDINSVVTSLKDKFMFHGYRKRAGELEKVYKKFVDAELPKQELANRLNVTKFILSMSENPTSNLEDAVEEFEPATVVEEDIDWPKYLSEGIERWSPPLDDESSESWSDEELEQSLLLPNESNLDTRNLQNRTVTLKVPDSEDLFAEYQSSQTELLKNVQSEWFNSEKIIAKPPSDHPNANVAILWDNFVNNYTGGLLPFQSSSVISEYKILREIMWQFREPHKSFSFDFVGDRLLPKSDVTISSVRANTCEMFLYEFVPYIDWLQKLKEFHESLLFKCEVEEVLPSDTYRSYDFAQQAIIAPILDEFGRIEERIKAQEETFTLLKLAKEVRPLFKTVKTLKDIHDRAILDFKIHTPLQCASTLLSTLHEELLYAHSKDELDLLLALYLQSLYKYFSIVGSWLGRDVLEDSTGEFVVTNKAQLGDKDWQMKFLVKDLPKTATHDGIIRILNTKAVQIGKNIHLLRLLGKLYLLDLEDVESLHEEYVRRVLEEIGVYFDYHEEIEVEPIEMEENTNGECEFIFPATCPDECKYPTEMDKLENLVDVTDGFLMNAFSEFFIQKPSKKRTEIKTLTLYERIKRITKSIFPIQEITERVLNEILTRRFSASGIMVKKLLIEDYQLVKQFTFLRHIFLFQDDLIFPLYRRIFDKLDSKGVWGNKIWLTSHVQDVLMDMYPNFYSECCVDVKENWKYCDDPLKACGMINMQYSIKWPLNLIIRDEHIDMYKELFQFIMKIKWALYTLNHLYFSDLQLSDYHHKSLKRITTKLKILRFDLLNEFSSIQHYVLGHVFYKHIERFNANLDDAYDLESLRQAHDGFIEALHKKCLAFRDFNTNSHGFYLLLYLVRKLRMMWKYIETVDSSDLEKSEKAFDLCHKKLEPLIFPDSILSAN